MSWEEWVQDVGKDIVGKWSNKEFETETQQRMALGALGENGYYMEGMAGVRPTANSVTQLGAMSTGAKLALGAAALLVVVLVLKD